MKALIVTLLSIPVICLSAPPTFPWVLSFRDTNTTVVLTNYVPTSNSCYVVYGTNNAAAPLSTWPVTGVYTNWVLTTNADGVWYNVTINITQDTWFFWSQASNVWSLGPPSNVAQTGPGPSTPWLKLSR